MSDIVRVYDFVNVYFLDHRNIFPAPNRIFLNINSVANPSGVVHTIKKTIFMNSVCWVGTTLDSYVTKRCRMRWCLIGNTRQREMCMTEQNNIERTNLLI